MVKANKHAAILQFYMRVRSSFIIIGTKLNMSSFFSADFQLQKRSKFCKEKNPINLFSKKKIISPEQDVSVPDSDFADGPFHRLKAADYGGGDVVSQNHRPVHVH
jgi:hypothetical protein